MKLERRRAIKHLYVEPDTQDRGRIGQSVIDHGGAASTPTRDGDGESAAVAPSLLSGSLLLPPCRRRRCCCFPPKPSFSLEAGGVKMTPWLRRCIFACILLFRQTESHYALLLHIYGIIPVRRRTLHDHRNNPRFTSHRLHGLRGGKMHVQPYCLAVKVLLTTQINTGNDRSSSFSANEGESTGDAGIVCRLPG